MATRSIITHQPEVSCEVCGRRLLRGERPDVFLDAGSRRTVCELCVRRAAEEGWLRASDAPATTVPRPPRPRRGRSLFERLRGAAYTDLPAMISKELEEPAAEATAADEHARPESSFDFEAAATEAPATRPAVDAGRDHLAGAPDADSMSDALPTPPDADPAARLAIETFNASECSSRVAGIARALGEPSVTVRVTDEDRVSVVIAWELCWYRYEVDVGGLPATIALIAEGAELDELEPSDRIGNAAADARGELALL